MCERLVCWVTSVGFQRACHSECLSWGPDLCESCFSSSLLRPSADGDPHPRWPTHQNKRDRGSRFPDKHHSLSLLWEGQGARRFISRGSPPAIALQRPTAQHTGAAKSKCQSGRRRCIPSRGQPVVAPPAASASPSAHLCPGCKTKGGLRPVAPRSVFCRWPPRRPTVVRRAA